MTPSIIISTLHPMSFDDAFAKVIEHFGSQAALARWLGVTPGAVHQYRAWGHMPIKHALKLERARIAKVRVEDLAKID